VPRTTLLLGCTFVVVGAAPLVIAISLDPDSNPVMFGCWYWFVGQTGIVLMLIYAWRRWITGWRARTLTSK
jgi:hypothetical protein